jgi:prophage regulatory protein
VLTSFFFRRKLQTVFGNTRFHLMDKRELASGSPGAFSLWGIVADLEKTKERFVRGKEVLDRIPLSRSALYERMKKGLFPRPFSLGGRTVAWLESDIDQWIDAHTRRDDSKEYGRWPFPLFLSGICVVQRLFAQA